MQAGIGNVACFFVFEFDETAFRATIADCLPLIGRHLFKCLGFPEWFRHLIVFYPSK